MATTSFLWKFESSAPLISCGIDSEKIHRFEAAAAEPGHPMPFVFSTRELAYARSHAAAAATVLCACFCCKEAVRKALDAPYNFDECELFPDFSAALNEIHLTKGLRQEHTIGSGIAVVRKALASGDEVTVAVYLFGKN